MGQSACSQCAVPAGMAALAATMDREKTLLSRTFFGEHSSAIDLFSCAIASTSAHLVFLAQCTSSKRWVPHQQCSSAGQLHARASVSAQQAPLCCHRSRWRLWP